MCKQIENIDSALMCHGGTEAAASFGAMLGHAIHDVPNRFLDSTSVPSLSAQLATDLDVVHWRLRVS